jgi:ComF family protein
LPPPPGVNDCRVLLAYEGAGRELVARLKHRNHRAALRGLAVAAASLVDPSEVDVVTWAPTTPNRRRARGYDQSELIARVVGRRLGRPTRRLLRRANGPAQTGRSAAERWSTPAFSPRVRPRPHWRLLLVDDVVTTGATVAAAARCLRANEPTVEIVVLALASTLLKTTTVRDDE